MTTAETSNDQPKDGDIPLEDIEKLLEAEDPEFSKQLEEVRAVEVDQSVTIEATIVGDEDPFSSEIKAEPETRLAKGRARMRMAWFNLRQNTKTRIRNLGKDSVIFLKTKPKEFALFAIVLLKAAFRQAARPIKAFKEASRGEKLTMLLFVLIAGATTWVLIKNVKGKWLPQINDPIVTSLANHADKIETFDPKDPGESFYSAFPQERHEFLFGRMKVNLKPGTESPNPMGAFELIVLVDSKDTAIEMNDREVEFSDDLQRVFEDETFSDLETELGKNKLKGRLKRELNQKLTQGWVKDISFKTFVIKP